jgi:hypothetical protein
MRAKARAVGLMRQGDSMRAGRAQRTHRRSRSASSSGYPKLAIDMGLRIGRAIDHGAVQSEDGAIESRS